MTDTATPKALTADDAAGRLLESTAGAMELFAIYLGDRLGCFAALADGEPRTAGELADATGVLPRYAHEWCEAMAAFGILTCDAPETGAEMRQYRLESAWAEVLTDKDSLAYLSPVVRAVLAGGRALPDLVDVYRGERTFGWDDYGPEMRQGQAETNRPALLNLLAGEWLPAVDGLHERLTAGGLVAEVGCGMGWASIGIATGYPEARVHGFDIDAPSVEAARRHADEAGVADRVTFHVADISAHDSGTRYDAVLAVECLHDMSRPVEALAVMRGMLADDGHVIVIDERTEESFTPDAPLMERILYGFSLTVCLPDGMSSTPSAGTGTVMRTETLREYAHAAGFTEVEVLPIEHDQFRFYRLAG